MPTPPSPTRLVISLTTTRERLPLIKPVVAVLVEQQTYKPDVVALAVRAADPLPQWLRRWHAGAIPELSIVRVPGLLGALWQLDTSLGCARFIGVTCFNYR